MGVAVPRSAFELSLDSRSESRDCAISIEAAERAEQAVGIAGGKIAIALLAVSPRRGEARAELRLGPKTEILP